MKKLQDICIFCIANNLDKMPRVGQFLAPKYKELILELIVKHDMLTLDYLPHVTYNLFSPSLRELTLFKCQQVDDDILKALGCCGAQFVTVKIDGCQAVTGEAQDWQIEGGHPGHPPVKFLLFSCSF